jgi:hypothetical protein
MPKTLSNKALSKLLESTVLAATLLAMTTFVISTPASAVTCEESRGLTQEQLEYWARRLKVSSYQLSGLLARGFCAGRTEPPDAWARPVTNIVHWTTGVGWGVAYGALASTTSRRTWARALSLGPVVWLSGYVVLPLAKVYKPIWEYDFPTLAKDLSAHIVYGAAASVVFVAQSQNYQHRRKGMS